LLMALGRYTDFCRICSGLPLSPNIRKISLGQTIDAACAVANEVAECLKCPTVEVHYVTENICSMSLFADRDWLVDSIVTLLIPQLQIEMDSSAVQLVVEYLDFDNVQYIKFSRLLNFPSHLVDFVANDSDSNKSIVDEERWFRLPGFGVARSAGGIGIDLYCLAQRAQSLGGSYGCAHSDDDYEEFKQQSTTSCLLWFTIPVSAEITGSELSSTQLKFTVLIIEDTITVAKILKVSQSLRIFSCC
jgi:hypothetical protein